MLDDIRILYLIRNRIRDQFCFEVKFACAISKEKYKTATTYK